MSRVRVSLGTGTRLCCFWATHYAIWHRQIQAIRALALAGLAMALLAGPATSQDLLKSFEERTTVHTLKNGWTFLIVERPEVTS